MSATYVAGALAAGLGLFSVNTVRAGTTGIRTRFGKVTSVLRPGICITVPVIHGLEEINNRIQNVSFQPTIKTKDNVFSTIHIGLQYQITPENSKKAFLSLDDAEEQLSTFVQASVRAEAPRMTLDELFASQDAIAHAVNDKLREKMSDYGYHIIDTLVDEIRPDESVMDAMNEIYASARRMEAAENDAQAAYIKSVKEAEASKQKKILQGEGISGKRRAIIDGYKDSVEHMAASLGLTHQQVIDFTLETQKWDTYEALGASDNAKLVFMDTSKDIQNVAAGNAVSNEFTDTEA